MTLRIPDLTLPKLDVTPKMPNFTAAVIDGILENKRVVAKDPQLKAYLGFAKVLFDRAKASPEEALAPYSDPTTNAAVAIFGAFSKLPSRPWRCN